VYDVATGIFRGYYGASQDDGGVWNFASSGYFYADPDTGTVGSGNYWLQYLQGTNSVVGIANELTQIGAEELRSGVIGHVRREDPHRPRHGLQARLHAGVDLLVQDGEGQEVTAR